MLSQLTTSKTAFEAAAEAKITQDERFTVMPATVDGIVYDRIFALSNIPLRQILATTVQAVATHECMIYEDERITTQDAWSQACRLANGLVAEYGIGPGDRIAIAMRNHPEWCLSYLAIIIAGATVVPLNAWWKGDELSAVLKTAGIKLVICDNTRMERLADFRAALDLTLILARDNTKGADRYLVDILEASQNTSLPAVEVTPEDTYCIMFTSGSTGVPKGVVLSNRSIVNAVLSWSLTLEVFKDLYPHARLYPENGGVLLALPLFHITALHSIFLLSFMAGRKIAFLHKWDAKAAIELIKKEKITNFIGVPTMIRDLVQTAKPGDLDHMTELLTGGAKRPPQHVEEQVTKFPHISPSSGYGLTETNALGTNINMAQYADHPDSAGWVLPPVTKFDIRDTAGKSLPNGEAGEVMIKSPANFSGYLNMPEETAKTLTPDGWFHTGDVGYFDEAGYLYIVDRLKDLIIRGGENISCLEVENEIYTFPGVQEVTVFALADDRLGEIVGAMILPTEGQSVPLEALHTYLCRKMASFKVPERMWLSSTPLPRGGTGKIDKRAARDIALQSPPHFCAR